MLIGLLGSRARERNSIIAVLMPFGLGLGILCLALYSGRAANKFGLLTGQIVAVDNPRLQSLLIICGIVIAGLLVMWRPLMFVSIDAQVAEARGVRSVALSIVFMILLGLVTAVSVQIVGALLVLSSSSPLPPRRYGCPPPRCWFRCYPLCSLSSPWSAASCWPSADRCRSAPTSPPSHS